VPREHVATLSDVTDPEIVGRLALLAAEIAEREGIAASGYRTVMNTNADAGQTVFHLHMHLLGGRPFGWPPG
jgi:histidine triad (HIT) family protein